MYPAHMACMTVVFVFPSTLNASRHAHRASTAAAGDGRISPGAQAPAAFRRRSPITHQLPAATNHLA